MAGGLQVQNRAGAWVDVQVPPEAFVVNLGDMMRALTTLGIHPASCGQSTGRASSASRRQSLVFFHNPNPDALVTCLPGCCGPDNPPRYADITAGEFIAEKSRMAYGGGS